MTSIKNTKKAATPAKNPIVKAATGIAAICVCLLIVVYIALYAGTRHGQEITVPDFSAMSVARASEIAAAGGIKIDVTDSVFIKRMERGMIYRQNPGAGAKVKKGRKVHVTINAVSAKKVNMPNVVGYSLRQAKAEIIGKGLNVGRLYYISDMATNNVLKQLYRSHEIAPGEELESDENIDLILGLNPEDNITYIPHLTGMKMLPAVDLLHDSSLNVGQIRFDETVKTYADSISAVVYRQSPAPREAGIVMGSEIGLYLTLNTGKLEQ